MVSEKPWKAEAVMLLISGLLTSMSLGALLSLWLPKLIPNNAYLDQGFLRFVIGTLSIQTAALLIIHYFLRYHCMGWRDVLMNRERPLINIIGLGLGVGLLVVPVTLAVLNFVSVEIIKIFQMPPEKQTVVTVIEKTVEPSKRVWFALAAVVLAPVVEETVFRGILYPFLKPRIGIRRAAVITSILFGLIHFNLVIFLPLVFLGLVLTWLYERTDSLLTPIVTHAVFNATNFAMLVYQDDLLRWFHERV